MGDDLTDLGPVPLICALQGLLLNNASDAVRDRLYVQELSITSDAVIPRNDASFSAADLLESPFFIAKNLRPLPEARRANARNRRLSGIVSKTARAVLKNFYSYDVAFAEWGDFALLVNGQDISSLGTLPNDMKNWGRMVHDLLSRTFECVMGDETGEVQELAVMHNALRKTFAAFDFAMKVKNGSDDDVTCKVVSTGDDFMFTEGKESACLPRRLTTGGHHLCTFGFATKLARISWKAPPKPVDAHFNKWPPGWHSDAESNNRSRAQLQAFLKVGGAKPTEDASTSVEPSARTTEIFRNYRTVLAAAKNFVQTHYDAATIEPHDPVNLWAGVMQACHYSVKQGRAMTIVQSARMWWFIKLGEEECVVRISSASEVGSRNFLSTVIKFLRYAHQSQPMSNAAKRKWERAIVRPTRTSQRQAKRKSTGPTTNEETNDSAGRGASKRRRTSLTNKRASLSFTEPCCDPIVVSSDSLEDEEETDSCFGYDEFGMAIPWLDQIGDTIEVLGRGRSGDVTKAVWNAQPVALKTFTIQFDDDRSLESVYEHELEVLRQLRDLWGEHVPDLLFHKPWPTSPMIGLELGEPLPDDMSTWSDTDIEKANESVKRVRELGWYQTDIRGSNFVRLKGNNKIAMIDFESMEKVLPPTDQALPHERVLGTE